MPMPALSLPTERHKQLRDLADSLFGGATMSATIGALIRAVADAGLIPHDLPGVRVNAFEDGVAVSFDDTFPAALDRAEAVALIRAIAHLLRTGEKPAPKLGRSWALGRRGPGYTVTIATRDGEREKVWTRDVICDFARLLAFALRQPEEAAGL